MVADTPSQEGREDLPSELGFALAPWKTDPAPIVTRSSSQAKSTSVMVTRSRAREDRWVSTVPATRLEPEIETRPEIPVSQASVITCDGGLRAIRPSTTELTSFTSANEPEVVVTHIVKEVTASLFTASQTTPHIITSSPSRVAWL